MRAIPPEGGAKLDGGEMQYEPAWQFLRLFRRHNDGSRAQKAILPRARAVTINIPEKSLAVAKLRDRFNFNTLSICPGWVECRAGFRIASQKGEGAVMRRCSGRGLFFVFVSLFIVQAAQAADGVKTDPGVSASAANLPIVLQRMQAA